MSNVPAQPGHIPGPIERQIKYLWDQAWKAQSEGVAYAFFPAQATAELNAIEATVQMQAPPNIVQDFFAAKNLDRSHRASFETHLQQIAAQAEMIKGVYELIVQQGAKTGFFALQSLGLANGAAALGALAYIGQHTGHPPLGMIVALGAAGSGFILTMLCAHMFSVKSGPAVQLLLELTMPHIAEKVRKEKSAALLSLWERGRFWPRILGWAAFGCLIATMLFGTWALLEA